MYQLQVITDHRYKQEGLRRSVFAVMLVNEHHFPHLLMFKRKDGSFALPGGRLRPGEDGVPLLLEDFVAPCVSHAPPVR